MAEVCGENGRASRKVKGREAGGCMLEEDG
jgi:hypothetical protein